MEITRNKDGFIDLTDIVGRLPRGDAHLEFNLNGDTYYFKGESGYYFIYKELIAEEIAKEMGIPVCYNDLAVIGRRNGVISKSEKKNYDSFTPLYKIFKEYGLDFNESNNLEDIWDVFYRRYKDQEIVKELMDSLVKIFIYDALIVNPDRHANNIAIVEKDGKPSIYPLYDSEMMASKLSVDLENYELSPDGEGLGGYLSRFIDISSPEYGELIRSYLYILESDNIDKMIKQVEDKIHAKFPYVLGENIHYTLSRNLNHINNLLEKDSIKRNR